MSTFASCCVLSYNRPVLLRDCLDTLQDAGAPYELIVHDDGSSDPEPPQVVARGVNDGKISTGILNPPGHNQGQGIALNRMFGMAQGDPILKLDQDLVFSSGWLKTINELLDSNREAAARGDEPRIGLLGLFHYHHDPCDSAKTRIDQFEGWSSRTHILGSAFAVTRECWEAVGPFTTHSAAFAEDWAFQDAVTNHPDFVCALPDQDLVANVGFGIGPSTVVVAPGTVQEINLKPVLL